MKIYVAADALSASLGAADLIARRLRSAVSRRGRAAVAFSGGSTVGLMFAGLAASNVPWERVDVFQVDERVAPDGDPARNRRMLDLLPVSRRQINAMPVTSADHRRAARAYAGRLPQRFDVVHLGIGDDGHTASWPPGDSVSTLTSGRSGAAAGGVAAPDHAAAVVITGPFNGFLRMTLTPPPVNNAVSRLVLVTGASKANAVARWVEGDPSLPVQSVRRTNTTVMLDRHAAAQLGPSVQVHPVR